MTGSILILICLLLLLAYVFDISSSFTRIPSVILLLLLGWMVKEGAVFVGIAIPDLSPLLPVLGTIGLILIVLEGSLELELERKKYPYIRKIALVSCLQILLVSLSAAYAFSVYSGAPLKSCLLNAIPLSIISSAIAIPSVRHLSADTREFITYESSLSDIFGVILFNFIALNEVISIASVGSFLVELLLLLVITIIATVILTYLLSKIRHHVKFVPIILMVVLVYGITKNLHLPSLIFILLFGLFLGNFGKLKSNQYIQQLHPDYLMREIRRFRELTTELAFLIRALFFLMFGFLLRSGDLMNQSTLVWSLAVCGGIFVIRYVSLKLLRLPIMPSLLIAPRGLITVLLFLSVPATQSVSLVNQSLIIQVVVLSALLMMGGLIATGNSDSDD